MRRVVITGLGVVAPNGNNVPKFLDSIKEGKSGIRFDPELSKYNFGSQVAGIPDIDETILKNYFPKSTYNGLKGTSIKYAAIASIEAFLDAGLDMDRKETDWRMGCIFGHASSDLLVVKDVFSAIDKLSPRRMGSRFTSMVMTSGACAFLTKLFAFGNHVSANSSACTTGSDSILSAYRLIKSGDADRMLTGSCESANLYGWGTFEGMRITNTRSNEYPEKASRPMSASAAGIVLGGGGAAMILEDLETAKKRGAKIYAEILGGASNCGGQRGCGTMTFPNDVGVQKCISQAMHNSNISSNEVDLICGHLTATNGDSFEINNWISALNRPGDNFPFINSLKSMIGHCLGATGSIESVAAVLQLHHNFIHPNINCEDLHPEIEAVIPRNKVPTTKIDKNLNVIMKANFGFGDVNCCLVFKSFS